MNELKKEKIFCIGLSKTGTSSLAEALKILGYKPIHYPSTNKFKKFYSAILAENPSSLKEVLPGLSEFNAFADIPFTILYKEYYKRYPNAKFILSIRDEKDWILSTEKHFKNKTIGIQAEIRKKVYGANSFDKEKFLESYRNHNKEVEDFFKDKKEKLLIFNLCKNPSWEPLTNFLGKEIPKKEFPHKNKTKSKK